MQPVLSWSIGCIMTAKQRSALLLEHAWQEDERGVGHCQPSQVKNVYLIVNLVLPSLTLLQPKQAAREFAPAAISRVRKKACVKDPLKTRRGQVPSAGGHFWDICSGLLCKMRETTVKQRVASQKSSARAANDHHILNQTSNTLIWHHDATLSALSLVPPALNTAKKLTAFAIACLF